MSTRKDTVSYAWWWYLSLFSLELLSLMHHIFVWFSDRYFLYCQQESYKHRERLGRLKCGHDFHACCIEQWLLIKNICPICKQSPGTGGFMNETRNGFSDYFVKHFSYPVKISVGVVLSRFEGNPLSSQLLKLWSTANGTLRAYLVDYGKSNGDAHRKPLSFWVCITSFSHCLYSMDGVHDNVSLTNCWLGAHVWCASYHSF